MQNNALSNDILREQELRQKAEQERDSLIQKLELIKDRLDKDLFLMPL